MVAPFHEDNFIVLVYCCSWRFTFGSQVTWLDLSDHTFLFLGAGEAGTGIAELIALQISKKTDIDLEEARKKIWLVDSKGLVVSTCKNSLQSFKQPWAYEREPIHNLLDAIKDIKPSVLIGTSGAVRQFTQELIETMSSINEKPLIMALSNPTSQAECTAEESYTWSKGRAIFASGSPFSPVTYGDKVNNAYIFPGFELGLIMCGATLVHDDLLLAASEGLAAQVQEEYFAKGRLYPPYSCIQKISANIVATVADKAYKLGLASLLPRPTGLVKFVESCMYDPTYPNYR